MIAKVDEAETFTKACPNMKSKLAGLSIKWLQQTSHALDGDPNPIAALTGMWSMMRLVCRCGIDCLKVVSQMTEELIGKLVSIPQFLEHESALRMCCMLITACHGQLSNCSPIILSAVSSQNQTSFTAICSAATNFESAEVEFLIPSCNNKANLGTCQGNVSTGAAFVCKLLEVNLSCIVLAELQ